MLLSLLLFSSTALAATRPVPAACTAEINAQLVRFLQDQASNPSAHQDNVMICGRALVDSFEQPASHTGTGAHQVTLLSIPTADGSNLTVEIVSNDSLDGIVKASAQDTVYAYGQAYITSSSDIRHGNIHPQLGVHDTHCATNSHMDDGWVVVNQTRYPAGSCSAQPRHHRSQY
jgi:hypothetical protein